jgi:hypothetical protein
MRIVDETRELYRGAYERQVEITIGERVRCVLLLLYTLVH